MVSPFGLDEGNNAEFQLEKVCRVAEEEEIVIEALVSPVISPSIQNHLRDGGLDFPYLLGLRLPDPVRKKGPLEIDTTIGNDYYGSLVRGEIIKGKGLMAMNSNFSWLLSGPVQGVWSEVAHTLCQRIEVLPVEDGTLNDILSRFWELNFLGMSDSAEDESESLLNKAMSFDEIQGRFTVQLLWKRDRPTLPSNLVLCKRRLCALVDRLARNPKHLTNHEKIIRDQLRD